MKPCVNNLAQNSQIAVVVKEGSLIASLPKDIFLDRWPPTQIFLLPLQDFFFSFNRHN